MNETHNNMNPLTAFLVPLLIALLGFACIVAGGLAVTAQDGALSHYIDAKSEVDRANIPANDQQRALDRLADVAKAGDQAIVAVAVSGDLAQTAIVKNQTSQLWAVAAIFMSVAFMAWVRSRKGPK